MTIACRYCGTLEDVPPLAGAQVAICPVCDCRLERSNGRSITAALACAFATFMLLFPANLLPLMSVSMLGMTRRSRLGSGVIMLWHHHWVIVAALVAAFAVIAPFVRFGLLSLVLAMVHLGFRPHWLGRLFRWSMRLDHWAMPDVYLIGCMVGYGRLAAVLPVTIGAGGICLICAALLCMLSRATLDARTVWRQIHPEISPDTAEAAIGCEACGLALPATAEGSRCPRCALRLRARKPDAFVRTLALVIAGYVLLLPANIYPMSTDVQFGMRVPHRIVDGIEELFQAHLYPLGVLIFCTSIAIPVLKLLGLTWSLLSVRHPSSRNLVLKTHLCHFIDEIGRWSNVDVFTIAVFTPLLQFPGFVTTGASVGATAFILVVVFTMFASRTFDTRLMWDAALQTQATPAQTP